MNVIQNARNLGAIFDTSGFADKIAIHDLRVADRPRALTFADIGRYADGVARGLARRGLKPGQRIGILTANRWEFLSTYVGVLRAGLVAVPLNYKLAKETLALLFDDAEIALVFADAERLDLCPEGVAVVNFDDPDGETGFDALIDFGDFGPYIPDQAHLAKILYTSGSTGRPKGVLLTHASQVWTMQNYMDAWAAPQDSTIVVAPAYHKNGLSALQLSLASGLTVVLMPQFEPRRYLEVVDRYRCTVLSGVPTMFALLARERDLIEKLDLSCVRELFVGSAPLSASVREAIAHTFPNAPLLNSYGTTEAPAIFGAHPDGLAQPPLSVGAPLEGVAWRLVGGRNADEGVLHVRTPSQSAGYLNMPEATGQKFRDGWYDTGDIMRRDDEGFFYFVGRADDMFVCGGENIYPAEVEQIIDSHPDVAQCAVIDAPDAIKGRIPVAFVVPSSEAAPTEEHIKQFVLDNAPAYQHPRIVVIRNALPLSATNKIDRKALAKEAERLSAAHGRA
ncbi:MAG: acyl--CoA ligase [Sphingomonadales bacterium]|nr:acyl--CoA ligase [Sphingomonadales bacterium]